MNPNDALAAVAALREESANARHNGCDSYADEHEGYADAIEPVLRALATQQGAAVAPVCHGLRRKGTDAIIGVVPNKIAERPATGEPFMADYEEVPLYTHPHPALSDHADAVDADAATLLEHYAAFIRTVPADQIEFHPYLPEVEDVAAYLRRRFTSAAKPVEGVQVDDAMVARALATVCPEWMRESYGYKPGWNVAQALAFTPEENMAVMRAALTAALAHKGNGE